MERYDERQLGLNLNPAPEYGAAMSGVHTSRGFWIGPMDLGSGNIDAQSIRRRIDNDDCAYCMAPEGQPCRVYRPWDKAAGVPPPYPILPRFLEDR